MPRICVGSPGPDALMRIAVDAMGGDNAPEQVLQGASQAANEMGIDIAIVGLPGSVQPLLEKHPKLVLVPCTQVIGMVEHPPHAARSKAASSMSVGARLREAGRRLKGTMRGFVGNVEPKDLYASKADVVVADGFVGNVAIKMAEATAEFLFRNMRDEIPRTTRGKLGGLLIRDGVRKLRARIVWREFGGAPLLGIDGVAVIAHGRSDARAIKNAIRVTREAVDNRLVGKIRAEVGK